MSEVRITDPKTGGAKGRKPERFELLPWDALEEVARVYAKGADKYGEDRNWERGYAWSLSFGALFRHAAKAVMGEDIDAETGCLHMACVVFHALALIAFFKRGAGTDDRAKTKADGVTAALLRSPADALSEHMQESGEYGGYLRRQPNPNEHAR